MIGWLRSSDSERPYAARKAIEIARVTCGERTDYWWAKIEPRLERGEAGNPEPLSVVLLAARHLGDSLARVPVGRPIHVYVCTLRSSADETPIVVDTDDVVIRHWGVLYPTKKRATAAGT